MAMSNGQWVSKSSGGSPIFIQTQAKNWNCYNTRLGRGHTRTTIVVLIVLVLCGVLAFRGERNTREKMGYDAPHRSKTSW